MQIIVSHTNLDFDGLASLFATKKLQPEANVCLSPQLGARVKQFLHLYADAFGWQSYEEMNWDCVTHITYVDCATPERAGITDYVKNRTIPSKSIDHHHTGETGANITLLVKQLEQQDISLSAIEATLFGLGLYSDTNLLTNDTVTPNDLNAAAFLLTNKMDLKLIGEFLRSSAGEHPLFDTLYENVTFETVHGKTVALTTCVADTYISDVSIVAEEIHRLFAPDATIVLCQLHKHTYVIARANSNDVPVHTLAKQLGGNGHPYAASAICRHQGLQESLPFVRQALEDMIRIQDPVSSIMSWPVHTYSEHSTIKETVATSSHIHHSGFPIVDTNGRLSGIMTKQDLHKAEQFHLGEKLLSSYMTKQVISVEATESIERVKQLMIDHQIGRIPVIDSNQHVIGIITRSDLIHSQQSTSESYSSDDLARFFGHERFSFLQKMGQFADDKGVSIYLVGGIIRDFILQRPFKDMDFVIEGNAIEFAESLADAFGGHVRSHASFLTTTWSHEYEIDLVTARKEFYKRAGALPEVRAGSIKEDLARRDFSINAIAVQLNPSHFGKIIDPFKGREQITKKEITILHPLSFIEDPTRLFRGVRLATRLGFHFDHNTMKQATNMNDALLHISKQRLYHELELMLQEKQFPDQFKTLDHFNVWMLLFGNELDTSKMAHIKTLFNLQLNEVLYLSLIAIAYEQHGHYAKKVEPFALTKRQRKLLNDIQRAERATHLTSLLTLHDALATAEDEAILFIASLPSVKNPSLIQYVERRQQLLPLVTGSDLITAGFEPGQQFSRLLFEIEKQQLLNRFSTKEEALHWITHQKNQYEI
ncbi:CBS domain-containing protein [Shouchella sp. JSM 1781072]|uniref:CBS domain-containing protein n=1 Tax=Shouchella sp. JSM 1781072 TaxID=3344581 RepID=UPI0035C22FF0